MAKGLRLAALLLWFAAAPTWAGQHGALIWELSGDRGSAWLLGSIHVAKPDLYPLPQPVEEAFSRASALVLEIDPRQVELDQLLNTDFGKTSCGDITAGLDDKERKALNEKLGPSAALAGMMPPGMLAAELVIEAVSGQGYSAENGIDQHFLAEAAAAQKRVVALETVKEQLDLLLDCESGKLSLKNTLDSLNDLPKVMDALTDAWRAGDAEQMAKTAITEPLAKDPSLRGYFQRYFFDRNQRMADKIARMIASGEQPFVVVGAGHLVGDQGVVALLAKRGYRLKQM